MYRVLSMDGGPAGSTYLRYLRAIEQERPGFLARTDLFAGVSDGATLSSFFAAAPREQRDLQLIDEAIRFNGALLEALERHSPLNFLRLATGILSARVGHKIQGVLDHHFGAHTTLRDLRAPVVLVSFRLKEPWGVKVFHNLRPDEPDLDEPLAVTIFKSSAFPVLTSIRDGFVDGGIYNNNPGMVALTQILHEGPSEPGLHRLDDIAMLSLGGDPSTIGSGSAQREYQKSFLPWGWVPWVLNPWSPALVLEALVSAGGRGTSFQCREFLGPRFLRVADESITVVGGLICVFLGNSEELLAAADRKARAWQEDPDSTAWRTNLATTLAWVDEQWMADPAPPELVVPESDAEPEPEPEPPAGGGPVVWATG